MTKKLIFFAGRPLILILVIPCILLLTTPFQLMVWDLLGVLGLILCIVGAALLLVSHWLVYRPSQWSAEQPLFGEPKRLVTHSLYRHIRNPNLLGIYFLLLGEASLFQSWPIFFYAILLTIPSVLQALTREESRLEQKFGDAYRKYKAKVPRFFPKSETGKRFVAVLLVVVVTLVTFKSLYQSPIIGGETGIGHPLAHLITGVWTTGTCIWLFLGRSKRPIAHAFREDLGLSLVFLGLLLWGLSHLLFESVDAYLDWRQAGHASFNNIALKVNSGGWMLIATIGLIICSVKALSHHRNEIG